VYLVSEYYYWCGELLCEEGFYLVVSAKNQTMEAAGIRSKQSSSCVVLVCAKEREQVVFGSNIFENSTK